MELFGSISEVKESNRYLRSTNAQGFGVYALGSDKYIAGGIGLGYGYRFLFLDKNWCWKHNLECAPILTPTSYF